jgi:hypothetical protein
MTAAAFMLRPGRRYTGGALPVVCDSSSNHTIHGKGLLLAKALRCIIVIISAPENAERAGKLGVRPLFWGRGIFV